MGKNFSRIYTKMTDRKIYGYLSKIGCCDICCLRFMGTTNFEIFRDPTDYIQAIKDPDEATSSGIEETVCLSCLGIFQQLNEEIVVHKIKEVVSNNSSDDPTYNVALTLPMCFYIKDQAVMWAVANEFDMCNDHIDKLKLKIQSMKDIWKARMAPVLEKNIGKKLMSGPIPSPFLIEVSYSYEYDKEELMRFFCMNKQSSEMLTRKFMESAVETIPRQKYWEMYRVPPAKPKTFICVKRVACSRSSLYLGGRYAKYSRKLSQTPWYIDGEKKMETSVQDLICGPMIQLIKADGVKFMSSGREDVDVRNLKYGRPFAVELKNPKVTRLTKKELDELVKQINRSTELVKVTSALKVVDNSDLKKLKEGENEKSKVYRALCTVKGSSQRIIQLGKLCAYTDLEITQTTPVRVLHRRPLVPRLRIVHAMRSRWLKTEEVEKIKEKLEKKGNKNTSHIENLFVLDIKTQAGTYVKEFVHGDFGRTKPSLGDLLGAELDIVALDVTQINLEWP